MATITKRVNRGVKPLKRYQSWDSSTDRDDDGNAISEGDIFEIEDSLGRSASTIVIKTTASGSCSFRINPVITVYPRREGGEFGYTTSSYDLVASGREFNDTSMGPIVVEANESFSLAKGEMEISHLEVVTMSGNFKVIVA